MGSFLPEDDGNGLSEELFVFNTVIRVLPFTGLHPLVRSANMISQHASVASCSLTLGSCLQHVCWHLRRSAPR